MSAKDELASFDASIRPAKCSSCRAEIVWCRTLTNRATPMEMHIDGTWIIVDGVAHKWKPGDKGPLYRSHFSSCPQAGSWRKRK